MSKSNRLGTFEHKYQIIKTKSAGDLARTPNHKYILKCLAKLMHLNELSGSDG